MNNRNLTAIIPNYNYASLLGRRIRSIVNQTIKPSEILFLDDYSNDESLIVAENLLSQHDIPWRIIKNDCNQGVFKQWLKGIELAKYNHVWIAEADDYCQLTFLETLLPAFDDEKVVLAYCQSKFDDQAEDETGRYCDYITRYFDFSRWTQDYKEDGKREIESYLCCINTIPNASSVVFKKSLVDFSSISRIADYRYNGDWLFYILCLSSYPDNKICYFSSPLNFFVRHQASVFGKEESSSRPIAEFLGIVLYLLENFSMSSDVKNVMLESVVGNLIYWSLDYDLNVLITKIMTHLPQDKFYMIYNQEMEKIIGRFKNKLNIYEHRIKERDEYILELKCSIEEKKKISFLGRIKRKITAVLSEK